MALMTINRVRIRSYWILPKFLWVIGHIFWQARHAPGNLGVRIFPSPGLGVWTVTAWQDETSMKAFRNSGAHGRAMPRLGAWFSEAAVTDWYQDDPRLPWPWEAAKRLAATGRIVPLPCPSAAQRAGSLVVS